MTENQTYIYESPDSGDTIYRRLAGSNQRELVREGPLRQKKLRNQQWQRIFQAAETDPVLQEMLEQIEVYHRLKDQP